MLFPPKRRFRHTSNYQFLSLVKSSRKGLKVHLITRGTTLLDPGRVGAPSNRLCTLRVPQKSTQQFRQLALLSYLPAHRSPAHPYADSPSSGGPRTCETRGQPTDRPLLPGKGGLHSRGLLDSRLGSFPPLASGHPPLPPQPSLPALPLWSIQKLVPKKPRPGAGRARPCQAPTS